LLLESELFSLIFMANKKTEESIRRYLESLGQTAKPVVDRDAVQALKAQIKAETDLINKAKLLSELERESAGRVPDHSGDEAVFVAEGQAWAAESEITVGALQALGVPDDVLRRAGFQPTASGARGTRAGSGRRRGTRAPAMALDDVAAVARKLGSGWRLADLADKLDREPMTVRNYVTKLIDQGVIADLGEDPRHNGRGRAPKIYGMA
jgi:hypothetical protein